MLIVAGTILALGADPVLRLRGVPFGMVDFLALVGLGGMVGLLAGRITSTRGHLARLEPPNVVKEGGREG